MSLFRRRRDALVCRQAVELMTDYLEGALSTRDRERLEAHLAACLHCHEYLEQIKTTVASLGRVTPEDLSEGVRADLVAVYRQWRTG